MGTKFQIKCNVMILIGLDDTFSWTVRVLGKLVDISCTYLRLLPFNLQSGSGVLEVLQRLESSHFCMGNDDPKFFLLRASRKGVFMDATGSCYAFTLVVDTVICRGDSSGMLRKGLLCPSYHSFCIVQYFGAEF